MIFKINKNLILLVITSLSMIFYLNKKIEKLNLEKNIKIALDKKKLKRKIRYGGALGIGLTNSQNNQASWYFKRLLNPITRKIPSNIRSRELKFSESIPKNKTINSDWIERGPFNVGGRTRAIAIDVNNENIIMAGGVSGGIFRSENQGQTWEKITSSQMLHSVTTLKQDTRVGKTNIWYYGTGEGRGNSASGNPSYIYAGAYFYGNGLYKSTDNGLTWNSISSTASNTPVVFDMLWDIIWDFEINTSKDSIDEIYTATCGAIYKSSDGGLNWNLELGSNSNPSLYTEIEISNDGVIYAALSSDGDDKGIWRSEDGNTWQNILPSNWPANYDRIKISINPNNENEVYFLAVTPDYGQENLDFYEDSEWCSLWKYTFIGNDSLLENGIWEDKSNFIPHGYESVFDNFYAQGGYDLSLNISPFDENHIFIGGTNLYVSTDGFSSLDNINQIGGYKKGTNFPDFQIWENHHPDQHEVIFIPSKPNSILSANDGGVYLTNNYLNSYVSWISLNNGYNTTQLYTVTINEKQPTNTIIGGFQDNGNFFTNSTDPNANWVMPLNGDGSFNHLSLNEDYNYISKQNGKVYKLKMDENGNRLQLAKIDPDTSTTLGENSLDVNFIHPYVVDHSDNIMYFPDGSKIWRNSNLNDIELTNQWDTLNNGWVEAIDLNLNNTDITAISISKTNPLNRLYVGTDDRKVFRIDNSHLNNPIIRDITLYYGPGMVNGDFFHGNSYVNNIAIHPKDADVAMVVFSNYEVYSLYYTTNGGNNWIKASGNLEEQTNGFGSGPSCRWVSIMPFNDDTLYFAATSTGLYATDLINGDSTIWSQMGYNSIGNVVCEQVKTREEDSLIVLATHGNGIYTTKINSIENFLNIEFNNSIDISIYPNPANDIINISTNKVGENINIFNIKGKIISTNKINDYNTVINISSFPKGIYFIEINGNSKKFIKN